MATIKYWDGSAWQYAVVGKQGPVGPTGPTGPAGQASLQRFRYVATGGQTSVSGTDANGNTLAYTPGLEEVFINGAAQVRGQDYTATNGTSITGITALIAGDVVEIYAWGVFNVANTISNTLIDAKGDILAGTGADSVGRLAVGANDTVLTADSSTATGLKWAALPASTPTFTGCLVWGSGGQSIANVTSTVVNFGGTEQFDTDGFYNSGTSSSRITIPTGKGGYYYFWANLDFRASDVTNALEFKKNGSVIQTIYQPPIVETSNTRGLYSGQTVVSMNAGDYMEIQVYQDSGTSRTMEKDNNGDTAFGCYRIGV